MSLRVDYTQSEVAAALRVTTRTVRNLMKAGKLGFYRGSGHPRFGEHHLEEFRRNSEVKAKS